MAFSPEEVLFSPTTNCNLNCPHCDIPKSEKILPQNHAIRFLNECREIGIKRVGFTGGEPFLALDFLCGISEAAVRNRMTFGRIMTNAVWYKNVDELKSSLLRLQKSGYDGEICVSADAFHKQNIKKVSKFIEMASVIWNRGDLISIACVSGEREPETKNMLRKLAKSLKARLIYSKNHACIKNKTLFIKINKIDLSPVGKAEKLKNGWDGRWFKEDLCKGPGNVFFVMPDGDVKPCCGYANHLKNMTIGNIKRESAKEIASKAARNAFVSTIFKYGLTRIRKNLESLGVKFPGKTTSYCYFCNYILTAIPENILNRCLNAVKAVFIGAVLAVVLNSQAFAEQQNLKTSGDYSRIKAKMVKKITLPKGYHEGLFYDGANIWVNNGMGGKTWVIDLSSGGLLSQISPVAGFTEGLTKRSEGVYFLTDWYEKKVYCVNIDGKKMAEESSVSVAPAYPAGVVWNGTKLFVITWTRGLGTKFDLLEMDEKLNLIKKIRIGNMQEPCQMAWDGKNLWMTSWYTRKVYRIDSDKWEITGYFPSPVSQTTGIAWDGKDLWLTGTSADLYELEVADMNIKIVSDAFKDGEMIPKKYTGDGEEISPPLGWSGIPAAAKSIALISDDPDAPMGTWVHWVMFNIPPSSNGLAEGVPGDKELSDGARQGINSSRKIGYDGPCPPSGTHRYYFKLYALDTMLDLQPGATKDDLLKAMESHILAEGQIMGRYKR